MKCRVMEVGKEYEEGHYYYIEIQKSFLGFKYWAMDGLYRYKYLALFQIERRIVELKDEKKLVREFEI